MFSLLRPVQELLIIKNILGLEIKFTSIYLGLPHFSPALSILRTFLFT